MLLNPVAYDVGRSGDVFLQMGRSNRDFQRGRYETWFATKWPPLDRTASCFMFY